MQKIKIGVLDEEQEYVIYLTTYLQNYGKGKWDISAFFDKKALGTYLENRSLDIVLGTDKDDLLKLGEGFQIVPLWLRSEEESLQERQKGIYSVYRFQSADEICRYVEGVVRQEKRRVITEKPMIAVYSPIGRCGKTQLALDVVRNGLYGKWLYVGMEDYSSFAEEDDEIQMLAEEFLYYWKEKKEEKVLLLLAQVKDVIATGKSFHNTRLIQEKDIHWLKEIMQKTDYRGAVFDIGTGVLESLHIFKEFADILVPYVKEPQALVKKQNFEKLLELKKLEEYRDRMHFIDMNEKQQKMKIIQMVFGGDM